MFFKLTRYVLARSLTKLIAPDLFEGWVSDLNHEIERLTLENLALTHENRILRRAKKKISFTRFDGLLLGWFSAHLDDWEHVLITAKPATIRGWWLQRWNITQHPSSAWVSQQLREAFLGDSPLPDFLICDQDSIFSSEVRQAIKHLGIEPKRTSFRSPWQNAFAERFVGTCRRDLFDWIIVFGERHARKLMQEFVAYYHDHRTHLGLFGETPKHRPVHPKQPKAKLTALPRLGGLHHRYGWDTHSKSDENSARRAA